MSDVNESLKIINEVKEQITVLEKKHENIIEKINLWKSGTVFEGLHKNFSLVNELEFYMNKLDKIVDK